MRVTEEASSGVAEELVSRVLVTVASLADGKIAALAMTALAAGDRKRDDNSVADLKRGVVPADFDDFAHELVANDIA
jgi:hypothetical protein